MIHTLNIKSLDLITLRLFVSFLQLLFRCLKIHDFKIFFLPIKKRRLTILKSPHVHKKARQQFELTIYKVCINIENKNIVSILPHIFINKPKNVKISVSCNF